MNLALSGASDGSGDATNLPLLLLGLIVILLGLLHVIPALLHLQRHICDVELEGQGATLNKNNPSILLFVLFRYGLVLESAQ